MEVFLDGERIFDRKAEGIYPDLSRVREMKKVISAKIADLVPTPADN